jgi:hypothetical protein
VPEVECGHGQHGVSGTSLASGDAAARPRNAATTARVMKRMVRMSVGGVSLDDEVGAPLTTRPELLYAGGHLGSRMKGDACVARALMN